MDAYTTRKYREVRRTSPLLPARYALSQARSGNSDTTGWEQVGESFVTILDGFKITVTAEPESIYPQDGDLGHYVQERRHPNEYGDWQGNYPEPAEAFPMGLPYHAFRWTGVTQGDGGYFVPDGVEEQFDYFRRMGQSKTAARDLTVQWVEQVLSEWFGGPLTYYGLVVTASREGVELGSASMGTSETEYQGEFWMVERAAEYCMVGEAVAEARATVAKLCTAQ